MCSEAAHTSTSAEKDHVRRSQSLVSTSVLAPPPHLLSGFPLVPLVSLYHLLQTTGAWRRPKLFPEVPVPALSPYSMV